MLVLQGRGQCCPPQVNSAAGHLVEGPVDSCHRCNFVTFTFCNFEASQCKHRVSTAPACLPTLKICIPRHISHNCCGGPACLLTPRRAAPPWQLHCRCLQLCVHCALCSEDVGGRRPVGRRLLVHHPTPSVSQLCLCPDLGDMGVHHCRLVARRTDCERLLNFPITLIVVLV